MRVKLLDVIGSRSAIENIGKLHPPARMAFTLARLSRTILGVIRDFEAVRAPLIDKYYLPESQPGVRRAKSDDAALAYAREMREMQAAEIDLEGVGPIKYEYLESFFEPESGPVAGNAYITVGDLVALFWLMEE